MLAAPWLEVMKERVGAFLVAALPLATRRRYRDALHEFEQWATLCRLDLAPSDLDWGAADFGLQLRDDGEGIQ
eukprot:9875540-Lingulodinium_polyedra.AAC.1